MEVLAQVSSIMRKRKLTETQICSILKKVKDGLAVTDTCRNHGISMLRRRKSAIVSG